MEEWNSSSGRFLHNIFILKLNSKPTKKYILEDDLITAYNEAEYHVNGFSEPIYIGKHSEDAYNVLSKNNLTEWAYITAYNPMSRSLEEEENIRRNSELRKLVNDYIVIEGEGQDKQKEWPAEKSFFIAGISLDNAKSLAVTYGQRAIVYGQLEQPATLIITLDRLGNPG